MCQDVSDSAVLLGSQSTPPQGKATTHIWQQFLYLMDTTAKELQQGTIFTVSLVKYSLLYD